jgi:hypothetical protein
VLPACYKYTPVQAPELGMEVRAELDTEAAVRRSQGLDDAILRYDGVIVDITPSGLSVDVLIARATSAFQDVTIRDTIALENAEVRSLMQRTLSPMRTVVFTLGTGVAAFAIVKSIDAIVGGTGEGGGGGPPPAMRIPVFSWPTSRLLRVLMHAPP